MPNRLTVAAAILFIAGLALLAFSVIRGEGIAGIAVFIPFFVGSGPFSSLGVLCFLVGMVLLFFGMARTAADAADDGEQEQPALESNGAQGAQKTPAGGLHRPRAGGLILLGPIPIVFGSDPGISRAMFYVAIGLMATFLAALLALAFL